VKTTIPFLFELLFELFFMGLFMRFVADAAPARPRGRIVRFCQNGLRHELSGGPFVIMGFEKPAEGQICVPETPSQNPAHQGENRQRIKNE